MARRTAGAKHQPAPKRTDLQLIDQPAAEWCPIASLKVWADNPRKNERAVPRVVQSIERFGFGAPLTARKENRELIAGHTRLRAAEILGMTHVPVRFLDLSEREAHALALADNKLHEFSTWDDDLLPQVLSEIKTDMQLVDVTGFRLDDFFPSAGDAGDDDEVPEVEEPVTKEGDVWALGEHRVVCGDSFDAKTRELGLQGRPIDLVVTDPPFAIYGSSTGIGADIADDKMIRPFFENLFRVVMKHLREFGHCYVCCDWRSYATIWEASKRAQMSPKNCIVWDKGGGGLGSSYSNAYEMVYFCSRLAPPTAMKGTAKRGQRQVHASNIVRYARVRGEERQHNAAKPVEMLKHFIENSSDEGDLVVDFFMGSGSTLIAAERTKRRCVAFDLEPKECDKTVRRWEALTKQKARRLEGGK